MLTVFEVQTLNIKNKRGFFTLRGVIGVSEKNNFQRWHLRHGKRLSFLLWFTVSYYFYHSFFKRRRYLNDEAFFQVKDRIFQAVKKCQDTLLKRYQWSR